MNQNEISCLVAIRKGKATGIITERDLLKRVIVEAKNAQKTKIAEVVSSPLEVVAFGTDLEKAVRLMLEKKIKKLLVIDEDRLVGLVGLRHRSLSAHDNHALKKYCRCTGTRHAEEHEKSFESLHRLVFLAHEWETGERCDV